MRSSRYNFDRRDAQMLRYLFVDSGPNLAESNDDGKFDLDNPTSKIEDLNTFRLGSLRSSSQRRVAVFISLRRFHFVLPPAHLSYMPADPFLPEKHNPAGATLKLRLIDEVQRVS